MFNSGPFERTWRTVRRGSGNSGDDPVVDPDAALLVDPDAEVELPPDDLHLLRDEIDVVLAIVLGGFLGTLCRYELSLHWIQSTVAFPLTIFAINTSGSLMIGLLLTFIIEKLPPTKYLRPLTCVGFLGGWTTMSTLAIQGDHLFSSGHPLLAISYILATMVGTPLFAAIGIAFARHFPSFNGTPKIGTSP